MLILSRKLNEEIVINGEIKIKIISISDNNIKIGIEAPSSVKVFRGEVFEKIKENTIEASKSSKEKIKVDTSKYKVNKLKDDGTKQ